MTPKRNNQGEENQLFPKLHISYGVYKFFQIGKTEAVPHKVNKFAHDDLFDDQSCDCGRNEQNAKNNS